MTDIPLDTPIRCPVLVGRSAHLSWLGQRLDRARDGDGQIIGVAGEAGIGKSRLVAEATERARQEDMLVLEGSCFEPDRSLPYAPLLDLLRMFLSPLAPDEVPRRLGPAVFDLAALLPDVVAPARPPSDPPAEPTQEKRRLFHALVQSVLHLASTQPLLLVVEDLHWSDETSLEFLRYLARRIVAAPILLLLTYRNDDPSPGLAHFLADLERERLTTELRLVPLSKTDAEEMLRAIIGPSSTLPVGLLDLVHSLTEGNPFFVEEIAQSLLTDGTIREHPTPLRLDTLTIPRTIEDAVRSKSEQVSADAGRVLAAAAVAGRRVDFVLLQALTGCDELELLAHVKELIAAQLMVEESADRFAFRHALTRQAIYAGLLARERRTVHREIAETIERVHAATLDTHVADLAHHWFAADVWEKALTCAQRAGKQAIALHAPGPAIEHFTRAIEAAANLDRPPSSAVHRARGFGYELLGDFDRARDDYQTALTIARSTRDRRDEWETLVALGQLWAERDYARTGEYARQALTLARDIADPTTLARSLNRLGNWHANVDLPREAERHHVEALAIFEQLGDRRGIAETLDLLAMATHLRGDLVASADLYRRAIIHAEEQDDRRTLVSSLTMLTLTRGTHTEPAAVPAEIDVREIESAGERAQRIARDIGWRSGESFAWKNLAQCLIIEGRYGDALAAIRRSLHIAEEIRHRQWTTAANTIAGALFLELLALPTAQRHLEHATALAHRIGSVIWIRLASAWLGSTLLARGDPDAAEAVLDAALDRDAPMETTQERCIWLARAEISLARGDPEQALAIVDRLIATTVNLDSNDPSRVPALALVRGAALVGLGRPADAEVALSAAKMGATAMGWRPLLWRAHRSLGDLLRTQRRHDEARQAFASAQAILDELAATIADEELREWFLQQATATLPRPRSPSPRQAAALAFGGLTTREREVAELVAHGRSNREIAAALYVGERTVASHVHNILTKLEFSSRSQIARWMTERDLDDPD